MADNSEMRSRRAAALEEKKKRLEELKARRAATSEQEETSNKGAGLDDYIDTLLSSKAPVIKPKEEEKSPEETPAEKPKNEEKKNTAKPVKDETSTAPSKPQVETITMGTQTEDDDFPAASVASEEPEEEKMDDMKDGGDDAGDNTSKGTQTQINFHMLTKEERNKAITNPPFGNFITSASKKVERLLEHETTWLDIRYAPELDEEEEKEEDKAVTKGLLSGARVTLECPKWTRTRCITDMDWSAQHKELLVTSYHELGSTSNQDRDHAAPPSTTTTTSSQTPSAFVSAQPYENLGVDGLACVWSLHMPHRPEHLFTSASSVSAVKFHPTSHHLVVGGCGNGQLLLWDMRQGRLPVQKSTLSVASKNTNHAFPICSLQVAQGGSGLVSASMDGRVNFWSLANLRDPAESYMVGQNVSALAVSPESHVVVCGDERGGLHSLLPPSSEVKRSLKSWSTTQAHFGMVTSVATHPHLTSTTAAMRRGYLKGLRGMILTSGVDWTTKLWGPAFQDDAPLLSFTSSSYDYVCDAQWCPSNPSVFAAASTNGTIDLWNLAHSLEEPMSGSDGISLKQVMDLNQQQPVNRLQWSLDGKRLAVAAGDQLHVMGVSDDITRSKAEDESKVLNHLAARNPSLVED